jgi:phosphoglycerate dehydrogenase-like enzyme
MFDRDAFAAMRPGAWFVNVGRGEVVDETALVAALQSGRLGGAGLDVFAVEPLPADSPLWTLPNVIVTPHSSGTTTRSDRRTVELFIDNFARHTRGDPLLNVTVDELTV